MPRVTHVVRLAGVALAIAVPLAPGTRAPVAHAEDPPPLLAVPEMADRARILATELRRGPAVDLAPYLQRAAHPTLRRLAIRALGRIGDRAGAPDLIKAGLKTGDVDLRQYLHAAGLSAARSLEADVLAHAMAKDPAVAADALEALGWIGGDVAVGALGRGLHRTEPAVVAAALEGLARTKAEGYLERVVRWLGHPDADVERAAAFATWMLASARRTAVTAAGGTWSGDGELASRVDRKGFGVDAIRPCGVLIPIPDVQGSRFDTEAPHLLWAMVLLNRDGDERATQETLARIFGPRRGSVVEDALMKGLSRLDPVTRQAAVEAIAAQPRSDVLIGVTRKHSVSETDPLVREAFAVALAKLGDEPAAQVLLDRKDRPKGAVLRLLTELRVLAASKRADAPAQLVDLALREPTSPAGLLEALSLLEEKPGAPATKLVAAALAHADGFVRAAAVGLVGKHAVLDHLPELDALQKVPFTHAEGDVRQAIVESWAELVKGEKVKGAQADELRQRIATAARSDPSFTARAAARDAMKALKIDGAPSEDTHQPNDWQGLPRPKAPLLGVDLTAGKGPLTEAEILTLADKMVEEGPEFVVETDVGAFRLRIDAREAPVHAVSFLLCVANGVYEGTPWHRVVPSFVIQGGDPHGTGNGDAGYHLPDEITRGRFVRGALGMPKGAIRDTGGCQLFVMLSDYRPLDGRYTCYGMVVDGMATVDRVRIGDRILRIGMVQAASSR